MDSPTGINFLRHGEPKLAKYVGKPVATRIRATLKSMVLELASPQNSSRTIAFALGEVGILGAFAIVKKAPPLFSDGAQTTGHRNPLNQRSLPKRERGQEHRSLGLQSTVSADDLPIILSATNLFPTRSRGGDFFRTFFAASRLLQACIKRLYSCWGTP